VSFLAWDLSLIWAAISDTIYRERVT
jgi:hypothetical protein